jgi:integrase
MKPESEAEGRQNQDTSRLINMLNLFVFCAATPESTAFLRLSVVTLSRWRTAGHGPPYYRFDRRIFKSHGDASGRPQSLVCIHDLRHGFASVAASAGMSLPLIGKLLGHTQPATSASYAHLAARAAVNEIGTLIGTAMKKHRARPHRLIRPFSARRNPVAWRRIAMRDS